MSDEGNEAANERLEREVVRSAGSSAATEAKGNDKEKESEIEEGEFGRLSQDVRKLHESLAKLKSELAGECLSELR